MLVALEDLSVAFTINDRLLLNINDWNCINQQYIHVGDKTNVSTSIKKWIFEDLSEQLFCVFVRAYDLDVESRKGHKVKFYIIIFRYSTLLWQPTKLVFFLLPLKTFVFCLVILITCLCEEHLKPVAHTIGLGFHHFDLFSRRSCFCCSIDTWLLTKSKIISY